MLPMQKNHSEDERGFAVIFFANISKNACLREFLRGI